MSTIIAAPPAETGSRRDAGRPAAAEPRPDRPSAIGAMTIDVEDYYQVEAFASTIDRAEWDALPSRVERNTHRLLDILAEAGVEATFFTLGCVARRLPSIVRRIVADGHELASHGYHHLRVNRCSALAFRADVRDSKKVLEDAGGVAVNGYRAPTFSIDGATPWAHPILAEEGYRYSSSVYPVRHDLYGSPDAPHFAFSPCGGLIEIPLTTVRLLGRDVPASGGGYFRLFPYGLSRRLLARASLSGNPPIFYAHPWEIDPGQPRQRRAPWRSRLRHYFNLDRTEPRLRRLLRDLAWTRLDRLFLGEGTGRYPAIAAWTDLRRSSP